MIYVAWQGCYSNKFMIGNGTKQGGLGGVLSPFSLVMFGHCFLPYHKADCNIGGMMVNVMAYADDMVLLAPSWHALQELIKILEYCCVSLDIVCRLTQKWFI